MNRAEVLGIMSTLKAAYPSFHRGMTREDAEEAVSLWHDAFQGEDAETVKEAVNEFISTDKSGFPPSPGQIMALIPKQRPGIELPAEWVEFQSKHKALQEKRRAVGIPAAWEEAKQSGMSAEEWGKVLGRAGLDVGVILRESL